MQYAQPQSEISEIFEELDALSAKDAKNQLLMQIYNKADKFILSKLTEFRFSKINQALEIIQKYHVTDEELAQIFEILSDLFKEKGIYIDSADFNIESNGKEKWIHYEYALSVSAEELPTLEAELNIRLSELPSKIFDAFEIDIVSSEPITDKPKDMTEIILVSDLINKGGK